jgi:iron(III) transport system permease protein
MSETETIARVRGRSRARAGARLSPFWAIVTIFALAVFALLLLYPVLSLFLGSFFGGADDGTPWYEPYAQLFTRKAYYEALLNSMILGVVSTVLAVALGVPLAYAVSRFAIPGRLAVRTAIVLTFVSPPFIGAYAWVVMFGQNGLIRGPLAEWGIDVPPIYGWAGTILVLTLQGMPFVFLMVSSGLRTIDQSVEDAAINLGYTRVRTALTALLPLLQPSIASSALLVFCTSFTDIGTPMIIGQNLRVYPRLVYQSFVSEHGADYRQATSFAIVMVVITVLALLAQRWYSKKKSYGQVSIRPLGRVALRGPALTAVSAAVYFLILLCCVPLLVVVISSFLGYSGATVTGEWTLENFSATASLPAALWNTLRIGAIATVLSVIVGTLVAYVIARQRGRIAGLIDVFSAVPFAVSGVVFGIAFSLAFGGSPFFLASTSTILVLAYFIRRLPFSVRSSASQLAQMGTQAEEASVNLGVPPGRTFLRITVPMLLPAVSAGALLTWATTIKEFNATLILYGPSTTTLPVEIFRQISAGQFQYASAAGTVLILLAVVPVVLLFLFSSRGEEVVL